MFRKHLIRNGVVLGLACRGLVPAAMADEYTLSYGIVGGYEFIENVALRPETDLDISGGALTLPLAFTTEGERLGTQLTAELKSSRYDEEAWDSDDYDLQGRAGYQLERGDLDGFVRFKRDSTRTGEFLDTGITGFSATRREVGSAGASGNFLVTERNGFTGDVSYRQVEFETPRLRDFEVLAGEFGWLHLWSERTEMRVQAFGSTIENDNELTGSSAQTDVVGAQFGFSTTLSEELSLELVFGLVDLQTDYSDGRESFASDEYRLKGSLSYRGERQQLSATLASEPSASGNGAVVSGDFAGIDYAYRITDRSTFNVAANAGRRVPLDDLFLPEREFASVDLSIDYRVTEAWYLEGGYAYYWQDQSDFLSSAESNRVSITLAYRPVKRVWSR